MRVLFSFTTIFFFFLSALHCDAAATKVDACKNSDGILPDVQIYVDENDPCVDQPCVVRPGSPVYMKVNFTAPNYLSNIKPKVIATAAGLDIDYPLGQDDACEGIYNTNCPVTPGELVNYKHHMDLASLTPQISLSIKFSIVDKDLDQDVVCFSCDLQVKRN